MSTFSNKNHGGADSFGVIADWTHAMNQSGELKEVLESLVRLVRADAVVVVRTSKVDRVARFVGSHDKQHGKVWPSKPRSYSDAIVGEFVGTAKVGSIWQLTDAASSFSRHDQPPAGANAIPSDIVEVIVVPLESRTGHVDHIELQFRHPPAEHDLNLFIMLISTLVSGWNRRSPGLISKKLSRNQKPSLVSTDFVEPLVILDSDNPAGLSRCEFRICSLLQEGMTVNKISASLSIKPATVRSHLSSIFSKTDVSSQVELLHRLSLPQMPMTESNSAKRVFSA